MNVLRQFIYNNRWFLLIALLSLLLKIVLLLQGGVVNPDAATYIAAAEKHSQGLFSEGLHYYRMPFYPLLLAVIHFLIPNWILAGQMLTIIPLVLILWPLYSLTQRLFDRQSALWTILLFAVLPEFNTIAIMRDPLFLLFALSALLSLVVYYQDRQIKVIVGFVLFAVFAVLTRIEGVFLFVIALLSIPFYCWYTKESKGNQVRLVVPLISIYVALAFVLWGLNVIGISTNLRLNEISGGVQNLLSLNIFSDYQKIMQSLRELQQTLHGANLHNNLLEVTRHYAPLIYIIGLVEILITAIFPTSLLAFLAFRWHQEKCILRHRWLILLPWFGFVLLNILFLLKMNFIQVRYFWIPIVLTLPWVGYGTSLWWQERQKRKIVTMLVIVLIIVSPLSKTVTAATKFQDMTIVKAGFWLRDYDPLRQMAVLYNDGRLPLYAGRIFEVKKDRKLEYLRKSAQYNKEVELVILYLSNKKKENYDTQGFEQLKVFRGDKKTVIILKRQSSDSD